MTKVKIPKQVAGVKIPKKVRKRAKKAMRLAENPLVRDAAVAALGAIAEKKLGRSIRYANDDLLAARRVKVDADRLSQTIRNAALDGLQRFLDGFEEGLKRKDDDRNPEEEDGGPGAAPGPRPVRGVGDPD